MTADAALPTCKVRACLFERERELAELARLMREPGSLGSSDEPPALQSMGAAQVGCDDSAVRH